MSDAKDAFEQSTAHGAVAVTEPTVLLDRETGTEQVVAEILAYGDCVLRFVSGSYQVSIAKLHYIPVSAASLPMQFWGVSILNTPSSKRAQAALLGQALVSASSLEPGGGLQAP